MDGSAAPLVYFVLLWKLQMCVNLKALAANFQICGHCGGRQSLRKHTSLIKREPLCYS